MESLPDLDTMSVPKKSPHRDHRVTLSPWIGVLLLTMLAAGLRLWGLDLQSLSHDELSTWARTEYGSLSGLLDHGVRTDLHPPLHFMLIWGLKQLGMDSAIALRLPSAVAGILSVPLLYRVGVLLVDRATAYTAAALMAVSWCMVFYSQDARAYTCMLFSGLVAIEASIHLVRSQRAGTASPWWRWVQYIGAGTVTAYLHYYGLFFIGLLGICTVFLSMPSRRGMLRMMVALSAVGACYLPWLAPLLEDLGRGSSWIARQGAEFFPSWFQWIFSDALGPAVAVAILLLVGAVQGVLAWRRTASLAGLGVVTVLLLWLCLPGLVAFMKSLVSAPALTKKNLLLCAPGAYLLVSLCVHRLPIRPRARTVVGVGLVGWMLIDLVSIKGYYSTPMKRQYREAVAAVVERADEPLVVVCGIGAHYNYYLRSMGAGSVDLELCKAHGLPKLTAAVNADPDRPVAFINAHYAPSPKVRSHLESHFSMLDEQVLLGARVRWLRPVGHAPIVADQTRPDAPEGTSDRAACGSSTEQRSDWSVWARGGAPHHFTVQEGVVKLNAKAESVQKTDACLKQRVDVVDEMQVSGSWATDLSGEGFGQISVRFFGADGRWVQGEGPHRPYKLVGSSRARQDWTAIERTIKVPDTAAQVELCLELKAANGAMQARDLCISGRGT